MTSAFGNSFAGRRVLVTGHTGFKGAWLSLWLAELGAQVIGVSLDPPTQPSLFEACGLSAQMRDHRIDIRDYDRLAACFRDERPDFVFHLAAQPIVRRAFVAPRETFEINVMGTVNVLEAARLCGSARAVLVATSDKAYRNVGWAWPYRESDPLGGHEPYAGSKACAELVAEVYRGQRFQGNATSPSDVPVASARAGNVIGGGDWAADRLVPDVIRAIAAGRDVEIRSPDSVRPWQHVLECLAGYMQLAARLADDRGRFEDAWNFGPGGTAPMPVADVVAHMLATWPGHATRLVIARDVSGKEAHVLRVDSSKAIAHLGWQPCWTTQTALDHTIEWHKRHAEGGSVDEMRAMSVRQIVDYTQTARDLGLPWAAHGDGPS